MTAARGRLTAADFTFDEFCWRTQVEIPEWMGYRTPHRETPPGQEALDRAEVVPLIFAPDGRDDAPMFNREVQAVQWALDHISEISRIVQGAVCTEYPTIRTDLIDVYDLETVGELVPVVEHPDDLKALIGLEELFVHHLDVGEAPYMGFLMECTWEEEHGLGILMHGTRVVEIGDGMVAHYLWVAKKERDRLKAEGQGPDADPG